MRVFRYWYACSFRLSFDCISISFMLLTTPIPSPAGRAEAFFSYNTLGRMLFFFKSVDVFLLQSK